MFLGFFSIMNHKSEEQDTTIETVYNAILFTTLFSERVSCTASFIAMGFDCNHCVAQDPCDISFLFFPPFASNLWPAEF